MQSSESRVVEMASPLPVPRRRLSPYAVATADLSDGFQRWWVWGLLAWYDIKKRYRGSVLGPFWLTLTTAITIASLGVLNSTIFGLTLSSYLPFLSLGLIVWALISQVINDSSSVFIAAEHVIKQIKMPLSTQIYRIIVRNFIIFAHNIPVIVIVSAACLVPVGVVDLLVIPGLLLLILWAAPLSLLLGSFGARFRDVPQMIGSILQLAFFLTPIMWKPDMLKDNAGLALINPFTSFMEVIRAPLMGQMPRPLCWWICIGVVLVTWGIAFPFFVRFRSRIAYWA